MEEECEDERMDDPEWFEDFSPNEEEKEFYSNVRAHFRKDGAKDGRFALHFHGLIREEHTNFLIEQLILYANDSDPIWHLVISLCAQYPSRFWCRYPTRELSFESAAAEDGLVFFVKQLLLKGLKSFSMDLKNPHGFYHRIASFVGTNELDEISLRVVPEFEYSIRNQDEDDPFQCFPASVETWSFIRDLLQQCCNAKKVAIKDAALGALAPCLANPLTTPVESYQIIFQGMTHLTSLEELDIWDFTAAHRNDKSILATIESIDESGITRTLKRAGGLIGSAAALTQLATRCVFLDSLETERKPFLNSYRLSGSRDEFAQLSQAMELMHDLTSFSINNWTLDVAQVSGLFQYLHLSRVRYLSLYNTKFLNDIHTANNPDYQAFLASLWENNTLEYLNIELCGLKSWMLGSLFRAVQNSALRELRLGCHLESGSLREHRDRHSRREFLEALGATTNLSKLSMKFSRFPSGLLGPFFNAALSSSLSEIELFGNIFQDIESESAMQLFAAVKQSSKLLKVYLGLSKMSIEFACQFFEALNASNVREVGGLEICRGEDEHVEEYRRLGSIMEQNDNLESLELTCRSYADALNESLFEALGKKKMASLKKLHVRAPKYLYPNPHESEYDRVALWNNISLTELKLSGRTPEWFGPLSHRNCLLEEASHLYDSKEKLDSVTWPLCAGKVAGSSDVANPDVWKGVEASALFSFVVKTIECMHQMRRPDQRNIQPQKDQTPRAHD